MRLFKISSYFVGACLIVLMTGCASVVNQMTQQITVSTRDKSGIAISGADCTWKNTKAEGAFKSPSVVEVRRDNAALHIKCQKDGYAEIGDAFNSQTSGAILGNIILGGVVGAVVDHASGAAYYYPNTLTVWFGSKLNSTPAVTVTSQVAIAPPSLLNAEFRNSYLETNYSKVGNVDAVPLVSSVCRDRYKNWLTWDSPKGFAISSNGRCGYSTGTKPPQADLPTDPAQRALKVCERAGNDTCKLYAMDDIVVWKP